MYFSQLLSVLVVTLMVCSVGLAFAKDVAPTEQNGWERAEKNMPLPGVWGRLVSEGLTHDDTH